MYKVKFWLVTGQSGTLRLNTKQEVLAHIMLYFKNPAKKAILHSFNRNGASHYNNGAIEFEAYQVKED